MERTWLSQPSDDKTPQGQVLEKRKSQADERLPTLMNQLYNLMNDGDADLLALHSAMWHILEHNGLLEQKIIDDWPGALRDSIEDDTTNGYIDAMLCPDNQCPFDILKWKDRLL